MKWGHQLHVAVRKGRFKAYCSCGWQSKKHDSHAQAWERGRHHAALKEKQERQPKGDE